MTQIFYKVVLPILFFSLHFFSTVLVSAASLNAEIEINWSRVKPIKHYPEFWKEKGIQPPKDFFKNVTKFEDVGTYVSNGNIGGRHDFPYKVALISEMPFGDALCGASLISRWAVLTAASCIDGASESLIIFGASDIQNPLEPFQARIRVESTNYRIHPLYRTRITNSDIGVVRFNNPIHAFNRAVNVIHLPTPDMLSDLFANEETLSMGFGRTSEVSDYTFNLQFVVLSTMTNLACGLRIPGRIDTSHICTSGILRRGICSGDVGAPLVLERGSNSYQIGIASLFPESGCQTGEPSIFTRITSFMAFIEQHM